MCLGLKPALVASNVGKKFRLNAGLSIGQRGEIILGGSEYNVYNLVISSCK